MMNCLTRKFLLILIGSASFLYITSCAVNPATGGIDVVLMSESQELKIGKEEHDKIMQGTPVFDEEKVSAYVDSVGQKVAKNADRPDLTYRFTVIDDPTINAFALPGGYIYVNRGLLAYLKNEAQLAAVLAHEIGHVTARHAVRQDAQRKGAAVATALSTILTQSYDVGDATSLWLGSAVSGYGREMELEADKFGAKYLYNSGYDPQAMVDVISTLKDQERFSRLKARDQGKKVQSYHGVFATHPRNDQRLREIIDEAGKLPDNAKNATNEDAFREHMEGLIYGVNYELVVPQPTEANRFVHNRLGFSIIFPENWKAENQTNAIVAEPEDKHASMTLEVDRIQNAIAPSEYIRQKLGVKLLQKSEPIAQYGLIGHTGIVPAEGENNPKRIAVFYQGSRVYIITGAVNEPQADIDYDALFLTSIQTFRPTRVARTSNRVSKKIHYVRANDKTTFAALASVLKLGEYGEDELRLINGYYPRGEPRTGEWIKIIQ